MRASVPSGHGHQLPAHHGVQLGEAVEAGGVVLGEHPERPVAVVDDDDHPVGPLVHQAEGVADGVVRRQRDRRLVHRVARLDVLDHRADDVERDVLGQHRDAAPPGDRLGHPPPGHGRHVGDDDRAGGCRCRPASSGRRRGATRPSTGSGTMNTSLYVRSCPGSGWSRRMRRSSGRKWGHPRLRRVTGCAACPDPLGPAGRSTLRGVPASRCNTRGPGPRVGRVVPDDVAPERVHRAAGRRRPAGHRRRPARPRRGAQAPRPGGLPRHDGADRRGPPRRSRSTSSGSRWGRSRRCGWPIGQPERFRRIVARRHRPERVRARRRAAIDRSSPASRARPRPTTTWPACSGSTPPSPATTAVALAAVLKRPDEGPFTSERAGGRDLSGARRDRRPRLRADRPTSSSTRCPTPAASRCATSTTSPRPSRSASSTPCWSSSTPSRDDRRRSRRTSTSPSTG